MSAPYYQFEITYSDGFKEEHRIEDEVLAIGRLPVRTDIHINDSKLSGRHAEIRFHDNQITVWDLGSTNGTYFKGVKQTEEFRLSPGESFELGSISVKIVSINGESLNDARTMMGVSPFAEIDSPASAQPAPAHQPTAWEAGLEEPSPAPRSEAGRSKGYPPVDSAQGARPRTARDPRPEAGGRKDTAKPVESWETLAPYPSSDEPASDATMVRDSPFILEDTNPEEGASEDWAQNSEAPDWAATAHTHTPSQESGRRHGLPKFVILLAGIVGVVAFFLSFWTFDKEELGLDALSKAPSFVKNALGGLGEDIDTSPSALALIKTFLKMSDESSKMAEKIDDELEEADELMESLSEEERETAEQAREGLEAGVKGASTALKITAGLVALPFVVVVLLLLLSLIGLFARFGRGLGAVCLILSLAALGDWALLFTATLRVSFLGGGVGFYMVGGALVLTLMASMGALIRPERA